MRRSDLLFQEFDKWGFDQKGWSKTTRKDYYNRARRADRWLVDHRGVSLIYATPKDIKAFLFSEPPTAVCRNGVRQALIGFGAFLVDRGFTGTNPALDLPRLKTARPIPKALPETVSRALEAAMPSLGNRLAAVLMVFLYCGLRASELRLLEWSNVHEDRWLRFYGKGNKERAVPIHQKAWVALERWRAESDSARWVFPSTLDPERPMSATWMSVKIREVGAAVGIHLHPHLLRHTVATAMLDRGAKPPLRPGVPGPRISGDHSDIPQGPPRGGPRGF